MNINGCDGGVSRKCERLKDRKLRKKKQDLEDWRRNNVRSLQVSKA